MADDSKNQYFRYDSVPKTGIFTFGTFENKCRTATWIPS
jgi:hypothetical protein